MLDLHEGVADIFDQAQIEPTPLTLRYNDRLDTDTDVVRRKRERIAAKVVRGALRRLRPKYSVAAPDISRRPCPSCGDDIETRPGLIRPVHMGPRPLAHECLDAMKGTSTR